MLSGDGGPNLPLCNNKVDYDFLNHTYFLIQSSNHAYNRNNKIRSNKRIFPNGLYYKTQPILVKELQEIDCCPVIADFLDHYLDLFGSKSVIILLVEEIMNQTNFNWKKALSLHENEFLLETVHFVDDTNFSLVAKNLAQFEIMQTKALLC